MPAVLAGIAGAVAAKLSDKDDYKDRFDKILMMMYGINVLATVCMHMVICFVGNHALRFFYLLYISHVKLIYIDISHNILSK